MNERENLNKTRVLTTISKLDRRRAVLPKCSVVVGKLLVHGDLS